MEVLLELGYGKPQEVLRLFTEYTDDILVKGPEVKSCLQSQNYEEEAKHLQEKYGQPNGRLYLASYGTTAAGCVALRKLNDVCCEMKRLYVRPMYRGLGIGKMLMEKVISDATQIGYRHIRLDTFPFMQEAIQMYGRYGFYEIERYNDNPAPTAVFMQMDI
ncbi:MAG TPA: GNAT family N-acetyltransferase [Clostridia bacterium]|nr:GNAT family N-acetyltransferase [Clostridia bacterium]